MGGTPAKSAGVIPVRRRVWIVMCATKASFRITARFLAVLQWLAEATKGPPSKIVAACSRRRSFEQAGRLSDRDKTVLVRLGIPKYDGLVIESNILPQQARDPCSRMEQYRKDRCLRVIRGIC